ncbi:MAG: Rpn family recombination-promoting nuclease/putative transposase [Gammaproteobacteria bacterium]
MNKQLPTPHDRFFRATMTHPIDIIDQHLTKHGGTKLPVVYPMVFYNGPKPYKYSTDLFDLFEEDKDLALKIFWKPFDLIDLTQIPDEKFKDHLMFGVAAKVMKHIYDKDFLLFLKILIQELRRVEYTDKERYICAIFSYILAASEVSIEAFTETVRAGLVDPSGEKIMTLAEQFRQEGVKTVAKNLIKKGRPLEEIAQVTNLSKRELKKLRNT